MIQNLLLNLPPQTVWRLEHLLLRSRDGMPGAQPPRHVDQPEVGDDGVAVLEEDVLGL